jgi:hypothetical protein
VLGLLPEAPRVTHYIPPSVAGERRRD